MAAQGAARILGSLVARNGMGPASLRAAAHTAPAASRMLPQHTHVSSLACSSPGLPFSPVAHTRLSPFSCAMHSCSVSLSAPRKAEHHEVQHHETPQVVPRYTDDIPEIYYKYGAFKNFKSDSTVLGHALRLGSVCFLACALAFLNDLWSCEHWRFKHRLAGSYLEEEE